MALHWNHHTIHVCVLYSCSTIRAVIMQYSYVYCMSTHKSTVAVLILRELKCVID